MKHILAIVILFFTYTPLALASDGRWIDEQHYYATPWPKSNTVKEGLYKLTLTEQGNYQIEIKEIPKKLTSLSIYDENLTLFLDFSSLNDATTQNVTLKKGTYYVLLGQYGFLPKNGTAIATLKKITTSASELEPNSIPEQAQKIPLNTTIYGRNHQHLDQDYYTFTLNKAQKITFSLIPNSEKAFLSLRLRMEPVIMLGTGYAMSTTAYLQPGTYTFPVQSEDLSGGNKQYAFRLDATNVPQGLLENTFGSTPLNLGKQVSAIASPDGYQEPPNDIFRFENTNLTPFSIATNNKKPIEISIRPWSEGAQYYEYPGKTITHTGLQRTTINGDSVRYQIEVKMDRMNYTDIPYTILVDTAKFIDVPTGAIYQREIESLAATGIVNGYTDGTFKPLQPIYRKHVFAMLGRLNTLSLEPVRPMKVFTDLPITNVYYESVKPFYEAGIIDGNGNMMNIESTLTRAQLAKIIVNTFQLQLKGESMTFSDVSSSSTSYPYIEILASHGITTDSNGKFMPNQPVSRQHFVLFLTRAIKAVQEGTQ